MQPPYELNAEFLMLVSEVSQKLGAVQAVVLPKQPPSLRRRNRIKTIQASLAIEGNTLSIEQVTDIVDNKRVLGPAKDIQEVKNALAVYDRFSDWKPFSERSFLSAHRLLMQGLVDQAGSYRTSSVGIVKNGQVAHLAPPACQVHGLMRDLFEYARKSKEIPLIRSCVFHYELEFIHPFTDGNGRMGRVWQTVLLMQHHPVFAFLPVESWIGKNQQAYYDALAMSDKSGSSTPFITFMLRMMDAALGELLQERVMPLSATDRIDLFLATGVTCFSRKDYMQFHKALSTATASRDLREAVEAQRLLKTGEKNKTVYTVAQESDMKTRGK